MSQNSVLLYFTFVLVCFGCLLQTASTQETQNDLNKSQQKPNQPQNVLPSTGKIDDFWGNVDDHTKHQPIASRFFKPHEDDIRSSRSKKHTNSNTNSDDNNKPNAEFNLKSSLKKQDLVAASRQFSCTKRALLTYKLITNAIYQRLNLLSTKLTSTDPDSKDDSNDNILLNQNIVLQLQINTNDILLLNEHLNELQNIIDFNEDVSSHDDNLSVQTGQFCRNLDSIERSVQELIHRVGIIDPNRVIIRTKWADSLRNIFVGYNVNQLILWIVIVVIVFIVVFVLFPHNSSRQIQAITAIVLLILFLSMWQFYSTEYRQHHTKRSKQIHHASINQCPLSTKLHSFVTSGVYQCPKSNDESLPLELIEEEDFHEQFNLLEFLSKFFVYMFLSPLKQLARGLMELFEELLDGGASQDWLSLGAWFRSIVYSNVLRPLFALLVIYIGFKFAVFFNAFRLIGYLMNQTQEEQNQDFIPQIRNPNNNNNNQAIGGFEANQNPVLNNPQVIYQTIEKLVVHMNRNDPTVSNILPQIFPRYENLLENRQDNDEDYLSALEDEVD